MAVCYSSPYSIKLTENQFNLLNQHPMITNAVTFAQIPTKLLKFVKKKKKNEFFYTYEITSLSLFRFLPHTVFGRKKQKYTSIINRSNVRARDLKVSHQNYYYYETNQTIVHHPVIGDSYMQHGTMGGKGLL